LFKIHIPGWLIFFKDFSRRFSITSLKRFLKRREIAVVVGSSLNIKRWMPITLRWELIMLPDELRFYPYSPDRKVISDLHEIKAAVETIMGPFLVEPEVHYIDFKSTAEILRGGDAVAIYRKETGHAKGLAYVVLHPFLGLERYRDKRRAHMLHELIELSLMQRKNVHKGDYGRTQHSVVKIYERKIGKKFHLPVLVYIKPHMRHLDSAGKEELKRLASMPPPRTFEEQDKYYRLFYHILGIKKETRYL